uniref:Uncharacterized protein n=1 Tax=viral metagenome TaxID=1070528 RepID=A0A6H1ZRM5_9ZZZZ
MKEITEETAVAYDRDGIEIEAERLQKWAYNQLSIAPELLVACKMVLEAWHSKLSNMHRKEPPYLQVIRDALDKATR